MHRTLKIFIAVGLLAATLALLNYAPVSVRGSNDFTSYNSTTTSSTFASSTATTQLHTGFGTFGSVVMSSSSPATTYPALVVYDATSTMATATARVLAKFGTNNQTHGTYTYDSSFTYGLKLEAPAGFNGNFTVTWR